MKKRVLASFLLFTNLSIRAQVSIQLNSPNIGIIQRSQLWNVLIINSGSVSYDCQLALSILDRETGQKIVTAVTRRFLLEPGAKQLSEGSLRPIHYVSSIKNMGEKSTGLMPPGSYTACFVLVSDVTSKESMLAEECVPFDAEPLTPPLLAFPSDSAQLQTTPAQFSWIPPTPNGMFEDLKYEILLTEILAGQSANEAIQENIPFYSTGALYRNIFSYPNSFSRFKKDRWYAWQVIARDSRRSYAGKSEVWVFKIKEDSVVVNQINESYIFINSNSQEGNIFYLNEEKLHLKYYSQSEAEHADIAIKTAAGDIVQDMRKKLASGDNYFTIVLPRSIQANQTYKLEITTAGNKPLALFFNLKK
jgi:hypothetical protein